MTTRKNESLGNAMRRTMYATYKFLALFVRGESWIDLLNKEYTIVEKTRMIGNTGNKDKVLCCND